MLTKNARRTPLVLVALSLFFAPALFAQMGGTSTPPSTNGSITNGKDKSPLNYENTMNMASTREVNAYKVFEAIPDSQAEKKVKVGEDFVRKFPTGVLLPQVYAALAVVYIQSGQYEKGFAAGEKSLALRPDDVRTLANLSQGMARVNNPTDPDSAQKLQKAQEYAQKCIQLVPKLTRPENTSEQDFTTANNQILSMAHSALGTVYVRRGNYEQAIPDLREAARLDGGKDATNLYLLGIANQNSSHYAEAAEAYTKCAAALTVEPAMKTACSDGAAQSQKHQ